MSQAEVNPGQRPASRIRRIGLVLILMLVAYSTRSYTLTAIGNWLNVGQTAQHSDYAVVLNGDRDTRPFAAADLYRRGLADRVLIMSLKESRRTAQPKVKDVVHAILSRCGVAESDIVFIGSSCKTTFEEAQALNDFLADQDDATANVVTNDYHTRRARWTFDKVLGPGMSQIRVVSAKTDFYNANNWWQHEEGFVMYLSEFFKLGFYHVRYGHGVAWIAGICGALGLGFWIRRRRRITMGVT